MYTREDYIRDNLDWQTPHLFPWEQDCNYRGIKAR